MYTIAKNDGDLVEDCTKLGSFFSAEAVGRHLREHPDNYPEDAIVWNLDGLGRLSVASLSKAASWLLLVVAILVGMHAPPAHAVPVPGSLTVIYPNHTEGFSCLVRVEIDERNTVEAFCTGGPFIQTNDVIFDGGFESRESGDWSYEWFIGEDRMGHGTGCYMQRLHADYTTVDATLVCPYQE